MKPGKMSSEDKKKLRRRAEEKLKKEKLKKEKPQPVSYPQCEADTLRLCHELQIYQVELEMQNEELKRANEETVAALNLYQDLYEFAPIAYVTIAPNGIITKVNLNGARLFGVERGRLIGANFNSFVKTESYARFNACLKMLSDANERYSCEIELRRENPEALYVHVEFVASQVGESREYRLGMTDISDRKAAEQITLRYQDILKLQLEEKENDLEKANTALDQETLEHKAAENILSSSLKVIHDLYENAPCGYHSLNENGLIVRMNERELKWLGYRRDEVEGQLTIMDILSPASREPFLQEFALFKTTGESIDLELEFIRKDGSVFPVLLNASAVKDADGHFVMSRSTTFDITARKKAEMDAIQTAHLATLGELAAGVAHEINNPINAIINYAQILVNKGNKEPAVHEFAGEILREGERIAMIVSSMLTYSRKAGETMHAVDVIDLLNRTLQIVSSQVKNDRILVKKSLPGSLPSIMAIPQQIQQVFLNLISNACYALNKKYQGEDRNKTLDIRLDTGGGGANPVVSISFFDQGIGIPHDDIDKITKPFFTTKPGQQGTGLGLSICSNLIKKHGGSLNISSAEGRFTEVTVILPAIP
ncbi:MAG TPA: PAS domain S-box protein [Dissulfurispiraceae bacterium]|nr:PAS domain S-box protein [Dissulfurispiraceae bacterium]